MDKQAIKKYVILVLLILVATNILYFSIMGIVRAVGKSKNDEQQTQTPTTATADELKSDSKLVINVNTLTVGVGQTDFLTAQVTNTDTFCAVSYESSDESVATVDSGGRIDGVKKGVATITAKYKKLKAECVVTVCESKSENTDIYSTSINANGDVLAKNIAQNGEQDGFSDLSDGFFGVKKSLYKLYVSIKDQCVTAFTYDEKGDYTVPVKAMVCSTGENDGTPTGEYKVSTKLNWGGLFGDVYGQYITQFNGNYLFHSVPYYEEKKDQLEVEEYNKLGQSASMGCVRLAVSDARWIFDNCAEGTDVVVTKDKDASPLGVPSSIKITDFSCGWDPTDNSDKNPYNKKAPEIKGAKDITLKLGSNYDMRAGVKAYDTCSNEITGRMKCVGNVNTSVKGKYLVTYTVEDLLHRTAQKTVTVTVE